MHRWHLWRAGILSFSCLINFKKFVCFNLDFQNWWWIQWKRACIIKCWSNQAASKLEKEAIRSSHRYNRANQNYSIKIPSKKSLSCNAIFIQKLEWIHAIILQSRRNYWSCPNMHEPLALKSKHSISYWTRWWL